MSEQKQSTEGKPMYVESLMTDEEWRRRMRQYPTTSRSRPGDVNIGKTNSFKWRFGMGSTLSSIEIGNINKNLDYLRKKLKNDTH
jgi:hypothetical protein